MCAGQGALTGVQIAWAGPGAVIGMCQITAPVTWGAPSNNFSPGVSQIPSVAGFSLELLYPPSPPPPTWSPGVGASRKGPPPTLNRLLWGFRALPPSPTGAHARICSHAHVPTHAHMHARTPANTLTPSHTHTYADLHTRADPGSAGTQLSTQGQLLQWKVPIGRGPVGVAMVGHPHSHPVSGRRPLGPPREGRG